MCNSFRAKIYNDQLCYEVDLNEFSIKHNIENELKLGFAFIMDYNEDRQVTFDQDFVENLVSNHGLVLNIDKSNNDENAMTFLDTIGIHRIWILDSLLYKIL